MQGTDLTVAAVVCHDGRYLIVEEEAMGRVVFSQPGGHIENGESPEQALVREVREETACDIQCENLIGLYLWIHPQSRRQFLRVVYAAKLTGCDDTRPLDASIVARHWLTRAEVEQRRKTLRSPAVLRGIQDFESGRREPEALLSGMLPLSRHVDRVLARADLV